MKIRSLSLLFFVDAILQVLIMMRQAAWSRVRGGLVISDLSDDIGMTHTPAFPSLRFGDLEVRLAQNADEVDAAQALRYKVFYEEMGAKATPEMATRQRDFDQYDAHCDHLLILDHKHAGSPIVGTYRMIRRVAAEKCGGFYSASEYDIAAIIEYPGELLELGRSCIAADYRTGAVMQILWRGIAAYIVTYDIKLMFGCASFQGTDVEKLTLPLSYLYHHHLAPPALRAKALPGRYVDMCRLPREAFDPNTAFDKLKFDPRGGSQSLPPLIKGYIRVGCAVGDGAVIDEQFNTTDIFIVVKTDLIADRYTKHFDLGKPASAE